MRNNLYLTATIHFIGLVLGFGCANCCSAAWVRPNIVMILIDDMGYSDVGCFGSRFHLTPNIDRLASQGMQFTDAYAACPVCSPTRLSILAGKYPARVGLTNYIAGQRWPDNSPLQPFQWQTYMPPEEVTIAEALKESEYVSACIGKWHLWPTDKPGGEKISNEVREQTTPEAQGFDFVVSKLNVPNRTDKNASALTDRAIEFIANNKNRPFFLYLSHHSVHIPLEAPPELIQKYKRRIDPSNPQDNPVYAGMVEAVDTSVGRLLATLDELNLDDNTIVVFFSDNGGLSVVEGPRTPATSNAPLRDGKGFVYEGGIRVPMIVRWPSVVPAASTCNAPVSSVDFYPTFLEVSRTSNPPNQILDGESLMPLMESRGALQRDAIFWHYPHYSNQGGLPAGAIRQGDFKLIESYEDGSVELYDVVNDVAEERDLAASMPDKVAEMKVRFAEWLQSVDAKLPAKNPNHDVTLPLYSDPLKAPRAWQASGTAMQRSKTVD